MDASNKITDAFLHFAPAEIKPQLMLSKQTFNRIIIIGFMVLVGFCLAKAIYHQSVMGIILALTSLGAGIYFLYMVAKANEEMSAYRSDGKREK